MAAIVLRRVTHRFGSTWALRELDLEIEAGQTVALIGPSGSGKTSLLRLINRLLDPTSGSVEVLGEDVSRRDPASLRRQIGYVIQEIGTFPHYTVFENIATVPRLLGWPRQRIRQRVHELLELVGLPERDYAERYPMQLSGGQRQRVGFARALAADPPIILLDEPFGALDPITRDSLQKEFVTWARSLKKTFVLVTHDMVEAVRVAERVIALAEGRVVQDAAPAEIVRNPRHPIVEQLLAPHRYQLELMTLSVGLLMSGGSAPPPDEQRVIDVPAEASVWEALSRLSNEHAKAVRVRGKHGERVLSREQLMRTAG